MEKKFCGENSLKIAVNVRPVYVIRKQQQVAEHYSIANAIGNTENKVGANNKGLNP